MNDQIHGDDSLFLNYKNTSKDEVYNFKKGEECYLINAIWLKDCLSRRYSCDRHTKLRAIDNYCLLNKLKTDDSTSSVDNNTKYQLKSLVKFNSDYIIINQQDWEYLYTKYGGDPVIYFIAPCDKEYILKSGPSTISNDNYTSSTALHSNDEACDLDILHKHLISLIQIVSILFHNS
jgi:hypothetical protein